MSLPCTRAGVSVSLIYPKLRVSNSTSTVDFLADDISPFKTESFKRSELGANTFLFVFKFPLLFQNAFNFDLNSRYSFRQKITFFMDGSIEISS